MKEQQGKQQLSKNRQGIYVGIVFVISLIIVALLIAFKPEASKKAVRDEPPVVEFMLAKPVSVPIPVASQGSIEASTAISLLAEVSGKITYVSADKFVAGKFEKGDLLLQIDDTDYQLALTRSQANVASAEQKLARVEVEAEQARFDLKQIGRDASSSTDYALKKPHLIEARANLKSAKADYELAKLQLQRTKIIAPFNGRVSKKHVNQGQYVVSGTVLADTYSIEAVEVKLPLSLQQTQLLGINLNDSREQNAIKISLSADYPQGKYQWSAQYSHLEHQLDARSRLINLVAKVDKPFENVQSSNSPPLTPGMFVKAVITGVEKAHVVRLPRSALRGADNIWIIDDNDRLEIRQVRLYGKDAETVFIKSGVEAAERIIITAIDFPVKHMPLRAKALEPANKLLEPDE